MKEKLKIFLLVLLALTPFIELANASFIRDNVLLGNIGQVYKGLVIAIIFVLLSKKERIMYLLALSIGAFFAFLHYLIAPSHSFSIFTADILFIIKVTYIIPLSFVLVDVSEKFITWAASIAWLTIVANIIIGVFGFGHTQYALGFGYKGFFYSGNEMALTLMVTSAIILYMLYKNRLFVPAVLFSISLLFIGPLQGMKSLLLGLPLIALIVPLLQFKARITTQAKNFTAKQWLLSGTGILVFLISAITILYAISPNFFVRFSEITQRSGLVGAILSERDKYLKTGLKMYSDDFTLTEKVIGAGYTRAQTGMIKYLNNTKTIEMDPFDLFFTFGLLAFVYYFIWIIYIKSLIDKKSNYKSFALFINVLLLGLSVITGHVVYSTFLITYWAMANSIGQRKQGLNIFFLGSVATGGIATYMKETVKNAPQLNLRIFPTHIDGPLAGTIFTFSTSYFKLAFALIGSAIKGEETIIHMHLSTGGSFMRKVIVLYTLSWMADKSFIHLHSGESVNFFKKIQSTSLGKMLLSSFFTANDGVFVVSQTLYNDVTSYFEKSSIRFVKSRWHILPNAIALPTPLPKPNPFRSGNKLHIITVSRLNSVKNLTIIPKIASLLKKHRVNFSITIIGDGPDKARIQAAIVNEEVEENVKLVGHIPHEHLGKYYQEAHVFLLPSNYESFGLVVLEGYLYGLPAVTSDIGGLKDLVIDGVTGYRCSDLDEFVEILEILSHDSEKLTLLSKSAQELVKEYGYKEHVEKLVKIYEG